MLEYDILDPLPEEWAELLRKFDRRRLEAPCESEQEVVVTSKEEVIIEEPVIIETSDKSLHRHSKRSLARSSDFFRTLFYSHFKECSENHIRLPTIGGEVFSGCMKIVAQLERGEIPEITLTKAVHMLPAASFLCMDKVLALLSIRIVEQVDVEYLLAAVRMAAFRHPPLSRMLWRMVIGKFAEVLKDSHHLEMTEEEMLSAFTDEYLNISPRDEMSTLTQYTQMHPESSRLQQLASNCMMSEGDALDYPVIRNRIPTEAVVVMGGWSATGPSSKLETFNSRRNCWQTADSELILGDIPRAYHSMNVVGNNILVCGGMNGREFFNTARLFDIERNNWRELSNMHSVRCYLTAAAHTDTYGALRLFAAGGFNGQMRLSSCEVFKAEKNEWKMMPSMKKKRSDGSLVVLSGQALAIGGFDGRKIHNDVEVFDISSEQWYHLSSKMREGRTGVSSIPLNHNTIMVAGGFDGQTRLRTVEQYDMREGVWHRMPSMLSGRSNFGIEVLNNEVYVAGGFDGNRTTQRAEKFDIVAQKWNHTTPMNEAKSAIKLIKLDNQDHIRKLINFDQEDTFTFEL